MYYKVYVVLFALSLTSLSAQDVSATQSVRLGHGGGFA